MSHNTATKEKQVTLQLNRQASNHSHKTRSVLLASNLIWKACWAKHRLRSNWEEICHWFHILWGYVQTSHVPWNPTSVRLWWRPHPWGIGGCGTKGHGSVMGLRIGLGDVEDLFQPRWFWLYSSTRGRHCNAQTANTTVFSPKEHKGVLTSVPEETALLYSVPAVPTWGYGTHRRVARFPPCKHSLESPPYHLLACSPYTGTVLFLLALHWRTTDRSLLGFAKQYRGGTCSGPAGFQRMPDTWAWVITKRGSLKRAIHPVTTRVC